MATPDELERRHTLRTATERYDELRLRDALSSVRPSPEQPTLTREETLEMLALSEVLARKASYGRQATVRAARAAGASWTAIGAALGTSKQAAWEAHQRWLDDQGWTESAE